MSIKFSPGCQCCQEGGECPACDTFTKLVVSGISTSCDICNQHNGEYSLRTPGSAWPSNCTINAAWVRDDFNISDPTTHTSGVCGSTNIAVSIFFPALVAQYSFIHLKLEDVAGAVKVTLKLNEYYEEGGVPWGWSSHFVDTFDDCDAIVGATLPLLTSFGIGDSPTDFCDLDSAIVKLE